MVGCLSEFKTGDRPPHFGRGEGMEREVQQRIIQDNNLGNVARSTDFYICDIEYHDVSIVNSI